MRVWLSLLLALPVLGQGTDLKDAPGKYPVQAVLPVVSFGAEYLVRSVSARNQTFFLDDYLVVEVAAFPARGQTPAIAPAHFSLHITTKKKEILRPEDPSFVTFAVKHPDALDRPRLEGLAGIGNAGVILGRPTATPRFPGDPQARRLPDAPRAPDALPTPERPEPLRAEDAVIQAAFPAGESLHPRSGFLYFPYRGKTAAIKSVELVYDGPAGKTTLRFH